MNATSKMNYQKYDNSIKSFLNESKDIFLKNDKRFPNNENLKQTLNP